MATITKKFTTGPDVAFTDCPVGLFLHNGILCLKTEYYTQTIDGRYHADAYICNTGEYWTGGVSSDDRAETIVTPLEQSTNTIKR